MGSGLGAGSGADMLRQVLQQKFEQALAMNQMKLAQQRLSDENTRFYSGQDFQAGQNKLGREFTHGENEAAHTFTAGENKAGREFTHGENEATHTFTAGENKLGREFTSGENKAGRIFTGGQNDLSRGNALRIVGIQGQTARDVANINHATTGGAAQANEVADSIALIDQIANDPALNTAVGPIDQYVGKARDLAGVNRFQALNDQLVGKLSLAQAGKLKGQGQISDKERAMLAAAATALGRGLGEQDYRNELGKIRGQFERMQTGGAGPQVAAPANDPLGLFKK